MPRKTCKDRVLKFLKTNYGQRFSISEIKSALTKQGHSYVYSTTRGACISLTEMHLIETTPTPQNHQLFKHQLFWARRPLHLTLQLFLGEDTKNVFFIEDPRLEGSFLFELKGRELHAYVDLEDFAKIGLGLYWDKRYGRAF